MSQPVRRSYRPATLFLVAACSLASLAPQAARAAPRKITTVEGITEYQLDNGLRVLLFPDQSKPTVTVNITYFVGSRHEGYGETGMAHLLEHMVFKGTPNHPKVWKSLQDHGAQFNGTTWFDRTNYFETLAASEDNLNFALELEADRMVNSHIAKKDLESEFSVVRNEFEMGENNPVGVLSERIMSTAFLWHNYGKSTIGSREDIERVPIDRLQAFYKNFYQPDNAMLVVAGKFDPEKTLKKIEEVFGSIPKPTRKLQPTYTVEPTQDGEREVTLRRVGDVQAVGCVYHICAGSHDDMAPVETLASILDADQTGRLYKALIETEQATRVSASAFNLAEPGMLEITAEVRTEKPLEEARKTLLSTLDDLGNQEFTAEEVDRAKNAFAKNFTMLLNDSGRVGVQLSEWAAMGDWRLMFWYRDQMAEVTPLDVQRVAKQYLKPSNRTVGMFIPTKQVDRTKVPPVPDVVAMMKDYAGKEAVVQGESIDATPAAIEARTQRGESPVGIKLALLPKKTRGNEVNASLTLRFGNEQSLTGKAETLDFLEDMLDKGTTKHTKRKLKDELDKLKATVGIGGFGGGRRMGMMFGGGGSPGSISLNIRSTRQNLPAVMALAVELLKDSTFPEKEFKKLRKQKLANLEEQLSEPMALGAMEIGRRMAPYPPGDIRYIPTLAERIERVKQVKLEDVKELYREMLGTGHAEMAVVGDFDPSEVRNLIDDYFKDWKSRAPYERIAMPYKEVKPDKLAINTPDKTNSMIMLGLNLPLKDDDADYPALQMGNFILGGNANSRILNRLRQKEGLSYGCGSMLMASPHEKNGRFMVFGICAPENSEKAVACAREEIEHLLKDGVTQQELDDAKKGYFEQVKVQLSREQMLAGMLARDLYLDRTMKYREEELAKIEKLTLSEINQALKKYIDPSRLIEVRAGDFQKTPDMAREDADKAATGKDSKASS